MTVNKIEIFENIIEKAKKRLGKPYKQQTGRKPGKGAGFIVSKEKQEQIQRHNEMMMTGHIDANKGKGTYAKLIQDVKEYIKDEVYGEEEDPKTIGANYYAYWKDKGEWTGFFTDSHGKLPTEFDCQEAAREAQGEISEELDRADDEKRRLEGDEFEKGKPYSQQMGRQHGKGAGHIVTPAEKLKEAQDSTDYKVVVGNMVENKLLNPKQAKNLLAGLSTLMEEYQIKYAHEIAEQRSKGMTEHGFDKAGFKTVENFTNILKKYNLTNHEVYAYKGEANTGTTDVWSNDDGSLKLITSGNPINKKGYSHYIGIEGGVKQADKLFDDIESINDFEAAEFGMSGYIGVPDKSYKKMSSEKVRGSTLVSPKIWVSAKAEREKYWAEKMKQEKQEDYADLIGHNLGMNSKAVLNWATKGHIDLTDVVDTLASGKWTGEQVMQEVLNSISTGSK
jgi:hypothetical protein